MAITLIPVSVWFCSSRTQITLVTAHIVAFNMWQYSVAWHKFFSKDNKNICKTDRVHLLGLPVSDPQSPRLVVQTVATAHQFSKGSAAGEPGLKIKLLRGSVVQSTGDNTHNSVGNVQHFTKIFSIVDHLVHRFPAFIIMGRGDHKLFNLLKLMNSKDSSGVSTMRPDLLSKACW